MDEFNRITLLILDRLYGVFPAHTILSIQDFFENIDGNACANFEGTMVFLQREGFITFSIEGEGSKGPVFIGVLLTMKGLSTLNKTPKALKGSTIATKIKSALKIGSTEAIKEVVKYLLLEATR